MILLGLIAQFPKSDDPLVAGKPLALKTRPISPVRGLPEGALVSVMEYKSAGSSVVTRVYRYVIKGNYTQSVNSFRRQFTPKGGWKSAPISPTETDFWRNTPNHRMLQQGLIVQATKLVKDPNAPSGFRPLPPAKAKGWVWISYDEEFKF